MVLLKAQQFQESASKKEHFNLKDIEAEARSIIAAARQERKRILEQTQVEIEQQRQEALAQGHAQGLKEGLEEGRKTGHTQAFDEAAKTFAHDGEKVLSTLRQTLHQFDQGKQELLWQAEQGALRLAIRIAETVLKDSRALNPNVSEQNLKTALELVSRNSNAVVFAHPDDLEHLQTILKDDHALGQYDSIRFRPDPDVTRGGCRVTTQQGQVDAQLETQLQRIADELLMDQFDLSSSVPAAVQPAPAEHNADITDPAAAHVAPIDTDADPTFVKPDDLVIDGNETQNDEPVD